LKRAVRFVTVGAFPFPSLPDFGGLSPLVFELVFPPGRAIDGAAYRIRARRRKAASE
jgi:hypothetical protein